MKYLLIMNLFFIAVIVSLGIKKYRDTGIKAYLFIALGFFTHVIAHVTILMGYTDFKEALVVVRIAGYVLMIVGLAV